MIKLPSLGDEVSLWRKYREMVVAVKIAKQRIGEVKAASEPPAKG